MAVRRWHVGVANGLLLTCAAYLAGSTLSILLAPAPAPRGAPPAGSTERTRYDVIAGRDLFGTGAAAGAAGRAGATTLRLVGTARDAAADFAVLEDGARHEQRLYRRGERVADGRTLVRIEADRVVLARRGRSQSLARAPRGARPAALADARAAAPRQRGGPGVRRGRDAEYLLDRREVQATLANLDRVSSQIRAVPNVVAGEPTGFRVFAIEGGSVFERLGLRNGDVVRRVNARALTDPARALAALQDLPRERRITLELVRRGETKTLEYDIR
jgi:general secretion pathway protein C